MNPSRWLAAAAFGTFLSLVQTILPVSAPAQGFAQDQPRVVDETGRPIEGARVYVQTRPHFPIPEEVKETSPTLTDANGRFTPPVDVAPESLIVVSREGFMTRGFAGDNELPDEIELAAGDKLLGSVVNDKGVTVSGALVGPPLPQGQIAMQGHRTQPLLYARSGADGNFVLEGVVRGRHEVLVQAPGSAARLVQMNTGAPKKVVLETGGTTVTGVVRGSRDQASKAGVYVEASAPGIKLYQRTDDAGRFTFPYLKDGEWQFKVVVMSADVRHPAQTVELKEQPEPFEVSLLMSQGVKIAGVVFDVETSAPVSDMALMLDTEPRREVKTDAQGRFEFENVELFADPVLRFDAIKYTYETPGGEAREYVEIPTGGGGDDLTTLTIPLRPRAFIGGRVVDLFKRPVAGATVKAKSLAGATARRGKNLEEAEYQARSRADGSFKVLVNPAGAYEVFASTEQFVSLVQNTETWSTAPAELTLEVKPSATVAGTVTDAQDQPIAGATVEVRAAAEQGETEPEMVGTGRLIKSATTAERGAFEITGFAPRKVDVVARHPDYGQKATATLDLTAATSPGLTLKFPGGQDFSAVVTREDGIPVPATEVRIYFTYGGQQKATESETDGKGRVVIRAIPATRLDRVQVRNPYFVDFEQHALTLPQKDFAIQLRSRGAVEVTVDEVAQPAEPSQALQVLLLRAPAEAGATAAPEPGRFTIVEQKQVDGKATFEQLEPAWYKAAARRGSLYAESEAKQLAEKGTTPLNVVLEAGGTVRGRVVDKQTNQPVADAVVSIRLATVLAEVEPVKTVSDASGVFTLSNVPAGAMELTAAHPNYPDHVEAVTVPSRGHIDVPVLLSSEKATLTGSVRSGEQAVPSALLVLHKAGKGENPVASAVSENNGQYTFEQVPPGRYVMTVEVAADDSDQMRHKQFEVTVTAPETRKEISFGRLTRVTGSVRVAGLSKAPAGRTLLFMPKEGGGSGATVTIAAGGTYETALEPGTYTVGLDDNPGQDVQVPPADKPHRLDLSL